MDFGRGWEGTKQILDVDADEERFHTVPVGAAHAVADGSKVALCNQALRLEMIIDGWPGVVSNCCDECLRLTSLQ